MSPDSTNKPITVDEIDTKLKVNFPHTVGCKIDELNRQVTVDRMKLSLEGEYSIPAGWRGKICMVSGIDREYILYDAISLPIIGSGVETPIGPYLIENISKDLIESKDEWQLEFRIVDLHGNEKILLRSPVTRRKPSDTEIQLAEMKEDYESQIAEKEEALAEKKEELTQTIRQLSGLRRENKNLQSTIEAVERELTQKTEEFKKELEEKETELKKSSEQIINSAKEISGLRSRAEVLQGERDQLKNERERTMRLTEEQKGEFESLQTELNDKTDRLAKQQEDIGRLEDQRDRAIRLVEDQKSRIEGLQAELESKQEVCTQRNAALEAETVKSRELEEELQKIKETLAEREKIINEMNNRLHAAEAQHTETQTKLDELQKESRQAIVERDRIERDREHRIEAYVDQVETLEKELEAKKNELKDREEKLATRNVRLNEMTSQLEKLREEIGRLEDERDQAKRLAEDRMSKIQGLQTELNGKREVYNQRGTQLETETARTRKLEQELKQSKELQARYEKTIEQQEIHIKRLKDEQDRVETEASQIRAKRNALENELSNQKIDAARLRKELTEAQSQSEDLQSQLAQAKSKITELQLKFEKTSIGQTMYERYDLIRRIRRSDTGEVYKVYDKNLDRAVALKILPSAMASDRRSLRQLTHEAQLLAKLCHINTVRLYDFVKSDESYIVTEYVEGRTFRHLINTDAPLPLDQVVDYVKQICKGLSCAHNQNIYHHNLNPEHLLLTDDGFVKITDFGVAATIRESMARMTGQTSVEMLHYLSPEQIQGNRQIDGRTDIYSLGIIFYEMLSGQPPFTGESVSEQHINQAPQQIEHVPPEINCILQKCLEKKADDRYTNIDELYEALHNLNLAVNFGK